MAPLTTASPTPCSSSRCFVDIAALLREEEQEELAAEELVEACMEELDTLYRERLQGRDVRQLQVILQPNPILPCHLLGGRLPASVLESPLMAH